MEDYDLLFVGPKMDDLKTVCISYVHYRSGWYYLNEPSDWVTKLVWGTSLGKLAVFHREKKLISLFDVVTGHYFDIPALVTGHANPDSLPADCVGLMSPLEGGALVKKVLVIDDSVRGQHCFVVYDNKAAKLNSQYDLVESVKLNCMSHMNLDTDVCWVDNHDLCFGAEEFDKKFNTEWTDFISFRGKLFGCSRYGNLYQLLYSAHFVTHLVSLSPCPPKTPDNGVKQRAYLLDLCGRLVMLFRMSRLQYEDDKYVEVTEKFEIYQLGDNEGEAEWTPLSSIGDYVIFVGRHSSFVVPYVWGILLRCGSVYFTSETSVGGDYGCYVFESKLLIPLASDWIYRRNFEVGNVFNLALFVKVAAKYKGVGETSCVVTEICDTEEAYGNNDGEIGCVGSEICDTEEAHGDDASVSGEVCEGRQDIS